MKIKKVKAVDGLDEAAPMEEPARRLGGDVSPAALALMQAQLVQAGGRGAATEAVEGFGGFAGRYEQIERVSAHHGNFWKVVRWSSARTPLRPCRAGRGCAPAAGSHRDTEVTEITLPYVAVGLCL